jgi:uncharacterized membrane protein
VTIVESTIEIDAPPDRVWEFVSDPRNLPKWDRRIASVSGVPSEGLHEGSEYETEMRFLGARARVGATVLELRAERYSKVRLHGMVDAVVETWLEPLDGNRTRLRHRVDYRFKGGALGSLAAEAIRLFGASSLLRHGTEAQKRQIEASLA